MTRKRWWLVGAGFLFVLVLAAIVIFRPILQVLGIQILDRVRGGPGAPVAISTADLSGTGPGSLLSATTMPAFSHTMDGQQTIAARVVYRSTEGDTGAATVVSGTVFTPTGSPPAGGWPVVSFGHGTLGIDKNCAPSLSDNLLGLGPVVAGLTKEGYAVAMADYQGLGSDGVHPYSDARTAGLNMIDAVRALRHTFSDVSSTWGAFGGSQGGGAAWAADEQADVYAPELKLVGAVAISPAADVVGLVDKAQAGTLTTDQGPVVQLILESLHRVHPDLNLDDYRRGEAVKYWDVLSTCSGPRVRERAGAAEALGANDFSPRTPEAAQRLRQLLGQWALPQRKLSAPLFVAYGGKDTYIDPPWMQGAIDRACRLGGSVTWRVDPQGGHGDVDLAGGLLWIQDRFADRPVKNDCSL